MNIKYLALKQPDSIHLHYHKRYEDEKCLNVTTPIDKIVKEMYVSVDVDSDLYKDLKERSLIIREVEDKEMQRIINEHGFASSLGEASN